MKQTQPTEKKRPQADIKWIRLQEICRDTVGRGLAIELHASTDIPPNLRAAVLKEGHRVDIALNILYNKTLDDVIESLAHELTHMNPLCRRRGPRRDILSGDGDRPEEDRS